MRSKQHVKTALAVTFAIAAVAAPAVAAQNGRAGWVVQANPDQQAAQPARAATAAASHTFRVVTPNPDQQTPPTASATTGRAPNASDPFDWGDAGIGAAGALGLVTLATAGALVISQRRARRPRGSAGATS